MDGSTRVVDAVAIRNGRFAELGKRRPQAAARQINLKGKTAIPGIVEPHVHIVSLANRPGYHTPIEDATSIAEVQATLAARRPERPRGQVHHRARRLAPEPVDRAPAADARRARRGGVRPAGVILQNFTGPSAVNSLGKAFFESVSRSPLAGPVTVSDDGFITGRHPDATTALYHLRVRQTFEDKLRSTLDAMTRSAQVGLTALSTTCSSRRPGR